MKPTHLHCESAMIHTNYHHLLLLLSWMPFQTTALNHWRETYTGMQEIKRMLTEITAN